jgi:heme A synthase
MDPRFRGDDNLAYLLLFNVKSSILIPNSRQLITFIVGIQIALGFVNIILLAPILMQIIHLLTADIFWIIVVLFFNVVLGEERN